MALWGGKDEKGIFGVMCRITSDPIPATLLRD